MRRTPLVLTEADSHLGLANRLLAGGRPASASPSRSPVASGERYLVTGRPVPAAVLSADRSQARRRFDILGDTRCLLVMGGSQGARSINLAAIEAFAERDGSERRDFHVIHLSGRRDYEELKLRLAAAPHRERYTLLRLRARPRRRARRLRPGPGPFRRLDLRDHGNWAGRRSSSPTRTPPPITRATTRPGWSDAGAAEVIEDAELGAELLAEQADALLGDQARLAAMSAASAALARPDAARRIADEVLAAAR